MRRAGKTTTARLQLLEKLNTHVGHTVIVKEGDRTHLGKVIRISSGDPSGQWLQWVPKIWVNEGDKFLNAYYFDQVTGCSCERGSDEVKDFHQDSQTD